MDGDSGNSGVVLRSTKKRRKQNRSSGSEELRSDGDTGTSPTIVYRHGISVEDAAAAADGLTNLRNLIAPSRFEKIKEKYFVVTSYTEARNEKILEDVTKILKIEKCATFRRVRRLLGFNNFLKRLLASQVFVLIFALDDFEESDDILKFLAKCFQKPIIVQFLYKDRSCLYFTDSSRRFKKLLIASNSSEYLSQINTVEKFNFEFLCNLFFWTDECYGRFNKNIMEIEIKTCKRNDHPTLADLTAEKGDLLCLKFLELFEPKFLRRANSEIVTEAMRFGSLEDLKLTLGISGVVSHLKRSEANRLSDGSCVFLLLAVQSGKLEVVKFLFENNCKITGDNATNCALNDKNFDILLELLLNDCPFPKGFDKSCDICSNLKFQELITFRAQFHKDIEEDQIERIKMFIKTNPKVRHAYSKDNQCALTTALKAKRFEIYSLLRSEGFMKGVDEKYTQTLKELDTYERETVKKCNRTIILNAMNLTIC